MIAAAERILLLFLFNISWDLEISFWTTIYFNSVRIYYLACCLANPHVVKSQVLMPLTKSAIKKHRSDKRKASYNKATKTKAKTAMDNFRELLTLDSLSKAFSAVDKAAKRGVIKTRKADRIKARLSKKVK